MPTPTKSKNQRIYTRAPVIENLKKARETIEEYEHWTIGTAGRDQKGNHCAAESQQAVQWCAIGAVRRQAKLAFTPPFSDVLQSEIVGALDETAKAFYGQTIIDVNDVQRTKPQHQKVLKIFDTAIERLKADDPHDTNANT